MTVKKIGIIGYGSMGGMLLKGFSESNMKSDFFVSTRNKEKLNDMKRKGITICSTNGELVEKCDLIFICVKPSDVRDVLDEIKQQLSLDKHVISIAGSVKLAHIGQYHSGKISRILPTLISEVKEGITLVCHNQEVTPEDGKLFDELLNHISTVKAIPENEFETASIITSCAPGLIAALFGTYVKSILPKTGLSEIEIVEMMKKTLYGTSKLFLEKGFSFEDTINRVATKGGSTEVGSSFLNENLPAVFDEMITKILERHKNRDRTINGQFEGI